MRAYGTILKANYSITIDGLQFKTKDGIDIFLDFSEADYALQGRVLNFRLKSAEVMIDGEPSNLFDNSEEVYELLKHSTLKELLIYTENEDIFKGNLVYLSLETPNHILHFKTNKCNMY